MKPLHIGFIVLGAALAGALAVKMTQPPVPAASTASSGAVNPVAAPAIPVVNAAPAKPGPIPDAIQSAPAPPAVYVEPAKPVIRKNKPNPVAKAAKVQMAKAKQPPWPPLRYEEPIETIPPKPDAEAPSPQAPATPTVPTPIEPNAAAEPLPAPEPAPAAPAPEPPRKVTLRTGTTIPVRLIESLSSDRNISGDTFNATLAEPLAVDGLVIAERGARVSGRVINAGKAGRVNGTSLLELGLSTLTTTDGQRIALSTDPWAKKGDTSLREDAGKVGGAAALGAIIGALAGGGTGAAIGAGIGGGAGAGTVMATRGRSVSVPTETIIRFRLASSVTITERE
jgi:hypothetical protein